MAKNLCENGLQEIVNYVEGGQFKKDLLSALKTNKENGETEAGVKIGENFIYNKFKNKLFIYKGTKCYLLEKEMEKKFNKLKKKCFSNEQIDVLKEIFSKDIEEINQVSIESILNIE